MIAGVILPLIPIITSMADYAVDLKRSNTTDNVTFLSGGMGFGQTRFPAILCTPTDKDVTFYSFVLPINVLLMFGCPFLVIIFWVVHKVSWYIFSAS